MRNCQLFISMIFLIEPFSPYQEPSRKKHWIEILEEEQLYYRIQEEQKQIEESLEANKSPFTKDARTFLLSKDDGDLPSRSVRGGNNQISSSI